MNGLHPTPVPTSRQRGAALVVGLILLVVLTILAVSGVFTATMELRMARNTQSQERAFQAAEVAVEDALSNPILSTSAPFIQVRTAVPNGDGDEYEYRMDSVGSTELGTGMTGFSVNSAFTAWHFQVVATGTGPDNAVAQHTQSFYVIGPAN